MVELWKLGGLNWKQLARRVGREIRDDDVLGQAAKLSYYFLLALFPLLLLLLTLFGYFAQSEELRASLLEYFRRVVPPSAFRLVVDTLEQVSSGAGAPKLSIGIVGTLWAASSGMAAVAAGLNHAYEVQEGRPWWKLRLVAIGLTVGFTVFAVSGVILVLAGNAVGTWLAGRFGLEDAFTRAWNVARWPFALFLAIVAINLLYRFAPDLREWKWNWFTPGALVAVVLWLGASLGFRLYLKFFNTYNATYGSLGALIVLMLWFYFTSAAILIGAEVNSEIENAAAQAGDPEARAHGEKVPGEKHRPIMYGDRGHSMR